MHSGSIRICGQPEPAQGYGQLGRVVVIMVVVVVDGRGRSPPLLASAIQLL